MNRNNSIIKKLLSATSILMAANFLVKFFGLLREILLAKYYGTSNYTDAYIIANNIPTVVFAAIGTSVTTSFIPMYFRIKEEQNEKRANSFTLHLLEALIIIFTVFVIAGEIFTKQIVLIFASGFHGDLLDLTILFSKILFPSIYGLALMNVFGSYLQQRGKFLPISIVPVVGNSIIICTLILSQYRHDIFILVWGTLFGYLAQGLFYIPYVIKEGLFRHDKVKILKDSYLAALLKLIVPVFMGEAVNELNSIVDRTLASGFEIGSVSSLNYAYKIINLIIGVFVVSIGTVAFPQLSECIAEKRYDDFKRIGNKTLMNTFLILVPIMVSAIVFREEIIQLLFQRGSFDEQSTARTAGVLAFYAIGIVAMGMRDILSKLFYSIQDTKIPMKNGIFCALLNIVLDIYMIQIIGTYGVALATSISAIVSTINLARLAQKRQIIVLKDLICPGIKGIVGAIIMSGYLIIVKHFIDKSLEGYIHILICGILGISAIYIYISSQVVFKNKFK